MRWFRAILAVLFGHNLEAMLREASEYGRLTCTQVGISPKRKNATHAVLGWEVWLRAHERPEADGIFEKHPQFSWKGTGETLGDALAECLSEARETPVTSRIRGDQFAPRLGGKAFDD